MSGGGGGGGDTFIPFASEYLTYFPSGLLSASDFLATIASLPGGNQVVYNAPVAGDEDFLNYYDGANQIGQLVLHNVFDLTSALVLVASTATNTIVLTDAVPAGWQVGDQITLRSQLCDIGSSPYYFDVYVGGFVPATATAIYVFCGYRDTVAGASLAVHPWEAYGAGKSQGTSNGWASVLYSYPLIVPLNSQRFCFRLNPTGVNRTNVLWFKVMGYWLPA